MRPEEKAQLLKLAELYFRGCNYTDAKSILDIVIKADSSNSKANELLGYIYGNEGNLDTSFKFLNLSCSDDNCSPEALYYFGSMQLARGYYVQAIESFTKSILKAGDFFEALHDLATAQAHYGDLFAALNNYKKCLNFSKKSPDLFFNIAGIYQELKSYDEAIAHYDKALNLKPDYSEAWLNKGVALCELQHYDDAITHYDKALSLKPDYSEAWLNKGLALHKLKRYEEAIVHYDKALSLKSDYSEAWLNKGVTLHELQCYNDAIAYYDKALSLKPDYSEAWLNKGVTLHELQCYGNAIAHYDKALSLKPDYPEVLCSKAAALQEFSRYDEAITLYEKAVNIKCNIDWIKGDLLFAKLKICDWSGFDISIENILRDTLANRRVSNPFVLKAVSDDGLLQKKSSEIYIQSKFPKKNGWSLIHKHHLKDKIRIGYFSADFRSHPVSILMAELFELHDKDRFEIIAFSFGLDDKSSLRSRIFRAANQFIDVKTMSDVEIVQLARNLEIDIAIDLGGHTSNCRTGIFAYRVAPIQLSYIGYLGTMGAEYYDYLLADKIIIPNGFENFYSEKIACLSSYQVNDRKRIISDKQFTREQVGLPNDSFIFCCFNNNYKILPATFDCWMRILKRVDNSVLFLYAENKLAEKNLRNEAVARGVDGMRLIFGGRLNKEEYLARYRLCDLFLDTFPYNAGTTASDALWVGLPVITMAGKSFASRVAASLLSSIGLTELITNTKEEYEDLAISFAISHERLRFIREKLSKNRLTTPLFDTPSFSKNLESIYIKMYEKFQSGQDPDHLSV